MTEYINKMNANAVIFAFKEDNESSSESEGETSNGEEEGEASSDESGEVE